MAATFERPSPVWPIRLPAVLHDCVVWCQVACEVCASSIWRELAACVGSTLVSQAGGIIHALGLTIFSAYGWQQNPWRACVAWGVTEASGGTGERASVDCTFYGALVALGPRTVGSAERNSIVAKAPVRSVTLPGDTI